MSNIERWKMIRRKDWGDGGSIIPPGAPVPTPDDDLEVFDVVRADLLEGAVACRDALAKLVRSEWPSRMSLVEIAETHRLGIEYEITDAEIAALRAWGQ